MEFELLQLAWQTASLFTVEVERLHAGAAIEHVMRLLRSADTLAAVSIFYIYRGLIVLTMSACCRNESRGTWTKIRLSEQRVCAPCSKRCASLPSCCNRRCLRRPNAHSIDSACHTTNDCCATPPSRSPHTTTKSHSAVNHSSSLPKIKNVEPPPPAPFYLLIRCCDCFIFLFFSSTFQQVRVQHQECVCQDRKLAPHRSFSKMDNLPRAQHLPQSSKCHQRFSVIVYF